MTTFDTTVYLYRMYVYLSLGCAVEIMTTFDTTVYFYRMYAYLSLGCTGPGGGLAE